MVNDMKNILIAVFLLSLVGCSHPKKTVFDSLTSTSSNDGVVMSGKWINPGYPLQTTVVSHNGQLFLEVGQLCLASNFRAPTAMVCSKEQITTNKDKNKELEKLTQTFPGKSTAPEVLEQIAGKLHEFKQKKLDLVNLLKQTEKDFNDYLKNECANKKGEEEISCAQKFLSDNKDNKDNKDKSIKEQIEEKYEALSKTKSSFQQLLNQKNLLIYDWSQNKAVSVNQDKDSQNKLSSNNNQNGVTVVSGYTIERIVYDCDALQKLRTQYKDSKNIVKLVTLTLSTGDLYYRAYEDSLIEIAASLPLEFRPELNQILKDVLGGEEFDTAIKLSSKVSSQGLISSSTSSEDKSNSHNITYYAVLTDLETLAGTCKRD